MGWWFAGPIVVFGVIPLLDTALGRDASNPPDAAVPSLEADRYYRWCTWLYLPLQYAGFLWAAWLATRGDLSPVAW